VSFEVIAEDAENHPITLTASNLPGTANFLAIGGTGTFLWASATPVGVYTSWFYASDINGISTQSAVINVSSPGTFSFREPYYVMDERFPLLRIDVDRHGGAGGPCTVRYATRNGSAIAGVDYDSVEDALEFLNGGTNRYFPITAIDDEVATGPTYFHVIITNALPGSPGNVATTTVVIVDDDVMTTKLYTDFTGGLPAGWTRTRGAGTSVDWVFNDPGGRGNRTGGTGTFAIVDSWYAGKVNVDARLQTPVLDLRDCLRVDLQFRHHFWFYSGFEYCDVDVSTNGSAGPWVLVWWIGGFDAWGREYVDLTPWAAGKSNIMIRFRYWNAYYAFWWQLDNIQVRGEVDSDGDGLPDWWEWQKFGTLAYGAADDFDTDDYSNMDEYLAGTDPTDDTQFFEIVSVQGADPALLTFRGSPLHSYSLAFKTNLLSPDWLVAQTNLAGNILADVMLTNRNPAAFYRIEANAPP